MGNKSGGVCTSEKNKGGTPKPPKQSPKKSPFGKKATIPQSKLDRVPITKSLNLAKCKYSSIPPMLFTLDNLEIVNLNDNNIKQIDEDLIPSVDDNEPEQKQSDDIKQQNKKSSKSKSKYKGIKLLRMSNNKLSSLPNSFANLSNLQTLQLVGNAFEYFPSVVFKLPKLKELSLRANQIQIIECSVEIIEGVKKLKELDLSFNALQYLPDEFTHLSCVEVVNLEHNQLNTLPDSWQLMTSLHILNVTHNELNSIPKSLFIETNVVRINMEENPVYTSKKYIHLPGWEEFSQRHKKNWDKGDFMGADRTNHTM